MLDIVGAHGISSFDAPPTGEQTFNWGISEIK